MHVCITVKNKDWMSISTMLRTETIFICIDMTEP